MATRENYEKLLSAPNVQKMLNLIASAEGVKHGYNTLFGNERLEDLSKHPNVKKEFTQTDGKKNATTAAGRYQFLKDTWDGVAKQLGLKDFSPKNQDIAAVALLAQNGALPSVLKGDFKTAVQKSGSTWASLPSSPYAQPKRSWSELGISNPAREQYEDHSAKIVAAYKQQQKEQEAKAQPKVDTGRAQRIIEAYQKARQNGQVNDAATQPQGLPDFDANGVITYEQPQAAPKQPESSFADKALGLGETALSATTGATGGTLGMLGGTIGQAGREIISGNFGTPEAAQRISQNAAEGAADLTYAPRTQTGQEYTQALGEFSEPLVALTPALSELALAGQAARGVAPVAQGQAIRAGQAIAPVVERAGQAAQRPIQATANAVRSGAQSLGEMVGLRTSETGPAPANIGAAQVPMDTQRLAMFDELGVTPTTAQVSRNPSDLAEMYNMARRGGESGRVINEGLEKQQRDLAATIDDMIEKTGAESTNFYATGGKINDALNTQFKVEKARVNKQYNQARESEGAKAKVDLSNDPKWSDADKTRADDAGYQLDQSNVLNLINENLDIEGTSVYRNMKNTAVRLGIADEDENGLLKPKPKGQEPTVNAVEEWRQRISELPSDEKDIRAKTRIKKLIDYALDSSGSNAFKQARKDYGDFKNAWTTRSIIKDLIEMKKGANSGDRKVIDEKIVNRITSTATSQADLDFIKKMVTKTEDGQQAWRDLQGTILNHIRNEAFSGADDANGSPALLASKLNKVIESLDGHTKRLDTLLDKQDADKVRLAGELSKVLKTVPENTGVNWSNTLNAGLAGLFDYVFVMGTTGLPLPIASLLRQFVKHVGDKKQVARANMIINSLEKSRRQSSQSF
ncbi:glycoside hydrolase family 104 protein [Acinetobacter pittii]|uniref:glycoside hydrolase family 24 protein n=1 Tax=Acinetobacter pittii TaxID=48296 RepID=UPI00301DA7C6